MELERKINEYFHLFNEVDEYIAKAIIKNKNKCETLTIKQFAEIIHVSQSALTRFAQKVGLQGYKEIKSMLRIERISKTNTVFDYQNQVIENYQEVIRNMKNQNNDAIFNQIYHAKRVLVYAAGFAMSKVASEFKRMFLPLEKQVYYVHGHDMMKSFSSLASEEDLVFIFSFKGDSKAVVTLAQELKLKNIRVISVTKLNTNELAQMCDYNLYAHTLDTPAEYQLQFESCTSFYLLIELLIIKYQYYCEHNFKK